MNTPRLTLPARWIELNADTVSVSVWEGPARDQLVAYGYFGESRGGTPETRASERAAFIREQELRARGVAGELTAADVAVLTAEIADAVCEGDPEVAHRREDTLREYALRTAYRAATTDWLRDVLEAALRTSDLPFPRHCA